MYCPYCGTQFPMHKLTTSDQAEHAKDAALEQGKAYVMGEIDEMLAGLARDTRRNKHIKFVHKPTRYRARNVEPRYREKEVDSELTCPDCGSRFQVYGIFGFCPGCRTENILIYDANLTAIENEIARSSDKDRALRHAYADLVSTFEDFCGRKARALTTDTAHFQDLFAARRFFKKQLGADIFGGICSKDMLHLRRVFQKRHTWQHARGIIGDRYVRMIPEDKALLGKEAPLSMAEFRSAARSLRTALDSLTRTLGQ